MNEARHRGGWMKWMEHYLILLYQQGSQDVMVPHPCTQVGEEAASWSCSLVLKLFL